MQSTSAALPPLDAELAAAGGSRRASAVNVLFSGGFRQLSKSVSPAPEGACIAPSPDPSTHAVVEVLDGYGTGSSSPPQPDSARGGARAKPWRAIGMRAVVMPLLIGIMVASTVSIGVVSYGNADATAESLISQLLFHASSHVQTEVAELFMDAVRSAEQCAWRAVVREENAVAPVTAADFPEFVRDARAIMHAESEIATTSLVLRDGSAVLLRGDDGALAGRAPAPYESLLLTETAPGNGTRLYYFAVDRAGRVPYSSQPATFDARRFPYYTEPRRRREAFWTALYAPTLRASALIVSLPFYESRRPLEPPSDAADMLGVVSLTVNVRRLAAFLAELVVTQNGLALILAVTETGERLLITARDPAVPPPANDGIYALVPVANVTNPLIRAFIEAIPADVSRADTRGSPISGRFSHGSDKYAWRHTCVKAPLRASPSLYRSPDPGHTQMTIIVGVASPYADFRGLVTLNVKLTIAIGVVCCVLVASIFVAVSIEISRQLRTFSQEVEAVTSLRPDKDPKALRSRLKELHACADAIGRLRSTVAIVTGMTDAVVVLDGSGRVSMMNGRALTLLGVRDTAAVLSVASFDRFLAPDDAHAHQRFRLLLRGLGAQEAVEFRCMRIDSGASFPAEISVGSVRVSGSSVSHVLVVRDASERHAMVASVRASESRATALAADLRNLVEHSNAPIVGVTADGRVDEWNAAMERITGCGKGRALGRPLSDFIVEGCRPDFRAVVERVLRKGREVESHEVDVEGGEEGRGAVRLMVNGAARRDASGAVVGGIFVGQDMSEKVRAIQMQAAADAKARLLAYVCHEVRTPLNGIAGMTQVLQDTELTAEQGDCLHLVSQCSEQLLSVVNDLLDMAKLEAGMVTLERIPFDLREAMEGVCELVAPAGAARGIEVVCRVPPEVPGRVVGDPTRFRQILINLAHNACKFTARGHVLVTCELLGPRLASSPRGDGGSPGCGGGAPPAAFRFRVTDTGMGMDEAGLGRLFRDFVQVNETITRKFGGTGMGLSICKQLAELMGGSISATSTLGVGTTFTLEISFGLVPSEGPEDHALLSSPKAALAAAPPLNRTPSGPVPPSTRPDGPLQSLSVLVATACAPIRDVFASYLSHLRCDFAFAASAHEARALLAVSPRPISALVVDDSLPELEAGPEAAGEGGAPALALLGALAPRGGPLPVPVLFCSSSRRGGLLRGLEHGPGRPPEWLGKPLRLAKLAAVLRRAVLAEGPRPPPPAVEPAPGFDRAAPASDEALYPPSPDAGGQRQCRVLLVEDQPFNQKVVIAMLKKVPCPLRRGPANLRRGVQVGVEIEVASDGLEGVEKYTASPDGHYDLVLMDVQMPRLDGIEATVEIRRLERGRAGGRGPPARRLPIVALTANALSADERRCYSAGMDAFLTKPVRREELFAALERHARWRRGPAPAGGP